MTPPSTLEALQRDNHDLRARLAAAEAGLQAIRSGGIDALVVPGVQGGQSDRIFTLKGADYAYRLLLENMSEGALTVSADGVVLFANQRLATMLQTPLESILGSAFENWVVKGSQAAVRKLLQAQEGSRHAEAVLRAADGSDVPVYLSATELLIEGMEGASGLVATDLARHREAELQETLAAAELQRRAMLNVIEDQAMAEQSLRRSEQRFRAMFESAPLGIAVIDSHQGQFLEVNERFAEITGWSREELLAGSWQRITHPDDVPTDLENVARMNAGETAGFGMKKRYIRKDGGLVWVSMTIAPLSLLNGERPRYLCMVDDITQDESMARALAAQEARFRALAEQSMVGIYTLVKGRVAYMNPRAEAIFGYEPAELMGTLAEALVADEDQARVRESIRRLVEGEFKSQQYEFKGLRKDGSSVMVGVNGSSMQIDGHPAILGVLQDITDKFKAEQDRRDYVLRIENMITGTVDAMSTMVELRDPYTSGHERRVGLISAAIAAEMGLNEHVQRGLRMAGAVHDVGKLAVPAELLSKPSRLSPLEFELIKGHARAGYEVLKGIDSPWPIAEVAHQHHERMDGSGYPRGLKGDDIILEARILAIADVVESMGSHRPYRPTLGIDKALAEIERGRGTHYDAAAVDACLRLFRDKGYGMPA